MPFSFTNSETKNGAIAFGWALGGGIDVMVMPNAFLRAEYEFVKFAPISGSSLRSIPDGSERA